MGALERLKGADPDDVDLINLKAARKHLGM